MIIGLVGPNASGKGEAAAHLARLGFPVVSLSDVVREEAARRGLPAEREHLIAVGQQLRAAEGPGVLAERILARLGARGVVDSIRSPAEIAVLRRREDFRLLGIDAPVELRWKRAMERGRAGDATDLESFRRQEALENTSCPTAQQVRRALAEADLLISNDGTLDQLRGKVEQALAAWGALPGDRPGLTGPGVGA